MTINAGNKNRIVRSAIILAAIGIPLTLVAESMWSGGAPDGFTGAPGENTCQSCHEFGPGDGALHLFGVPALYQPGKTYDLTAILEDPGQQRWGFQLTAVNGDGNGSGTFTITDPTNTQLSDNNPETARDYVKQTLAGTYNGTFDGPVTWEFQWTAPPEDDGEITFYVAAAAEDGDGTTAGGYSYDASVASQASQFPLPSSSNAGLLVLVVVIAITGVALVGRVRFSTHRIDR